MDRHDCSVAVRPAATCAPALLRYSVSMTTASVAHMPNNSTQKKSN
ncbi:hypothetical protein [Variovorax sp. PDNC026]|nr:hypothetical protein [Variovorax sp. PDNC026]